MSLPVGNPVRFSLTQQQFVHAARLHARPSKARRLFHLLITLFVAYSAWTQFQLGNSGYALMLVAILPLALNMHLLVTPLFSQMYRRNPALAEPLSIQLRHDGIETDSVNGRQLLSWQQIVRWREDDESLLLYINARQYLTLPKSIASQGFDFDQLRAQLASVKKA